MPSANCFAKCALGVLQLPSKPQFLSTPTSPTYVKKQETYYCLRNRGPRVRGCRCVLCSLPACVPAGQHLCSPAHSPWCVYMSGCSCVGCYARVCVCVNMCAPIGVQCLLCSGLLRVSSCGLVWARGFVWLGTWARAWTCALPCMCGELT